MPKIKLTGPYFTTRFPFPGEAMLALQVKDSARWRGIVDRKYGLTYPEADEIMPGPELGHWQDWPDWMRQASVCEACGWRGPVNDKTPCYGKQRSHFIRS